MENVSPLLMFSFWKLSNDKNNFFNYKKFSPLHFNLSQIFKTFYYSQLPKWEFILRVLKVIPFHFPNILGLLLALVGYWLVSIMPCVSFFLIPFFHKLHKLHFSPFKVSPYPNTSSWLINKYQICIPMS